ncbi:MAG TPA: YihY/virulence factor BrkB family protein [Dissulfurispiraceae bacterium]|nr:YihY/virulence factor BrkB family protein [Dissulfurispiraceae bacterium]
MKKMIVSLNSFFEKTLWQIDSGSLKRPRRFGVLLLRLFYKLQNAFQSGELTVRASSLVYTTLLTFVPLLAIAFAVLKGLGVHNMLAPTIYSFLEPLGEKGSEIGDTVLEYVDRINVKVLGTVGLAFLVYTAVNTVQQIETSFNHFWQITRTRSVTRKFRDYLSVLMVGPIMMVAAIGITTSVMNASIVQKLAAIEPFGTALLIIAKLVPYLLVILAFSLLYYLLPNAKVRFGSALVGGAVAGVLWQVLSWSFARVIVSSAQYSAVYSGFAIVLVFMIWLYFNWLIMLTGVKVAFYHQFPAMLRLRMDRSIFSERFKYRLALAVMYYVALHYHQDKKRWGLNALVRELQLPVAPILEVVHALEENKLLLFFPDDATFLPGRDIATIRISDVMAAVEHQMHGDGIFGKHICSSEAIEKIMHRLDVCVLESFSGDTVQSLLTEPEVAACEAEKIKNPGAEAV